MTDLRKAAENAIKVLEDKRLRMDEHLIPIVVDDLRQALAQPEQEPVWCGCGDGIVANDEAMCGVCVMRLKDQIERMKTQPEQEPVAYFWRDTKLCYWIGHGSPKIDFQDLANLDVKPLYTAPPSKPEQEPVAFEDWLKNQHGDPEEIGFLQALRVAYYAGADSHTAPPSKPWQSLTDEDILEGAKYSWVDYQAFQSVAWWADEKLKEKNT